MAQIVPAEKLEAKIRTSNDIEELKDIYKEMESILSHNRIQVESNIYKWK